MKKNIIIWANCQGGPIHHMLQLYYGHIYDIISYQNYTFIKENKPLPNTFYTCDIFLYQNYSNKDEMYCTEHIINNIIPPKAMVIVFPTLHSNFLHFNYDIHSPENNNTISESKPHGHFFYGIGIIRDLINIMKKDGLSEENAINNILNKINDIGFIPDSQILYYETRSLEFLKSKALNSDIPNIYNFIISNYKLQRLWHNPNHPSGILLNELCRELFTKMNLLYPEPTDDTIETLDNMLKDWKMPIFKSTYNYYNMKNIDNNCSSIYHSDINDEKSYITKYIHFLYSSE
jgi:hypothetical protein